MGLHTWNEGVISSAAVAFERNTLTGGVAVVAAAAVEAVVEAVVEAAAVLRGAAVGTEAVVVELAGGAHGGQIAGVAGAAHGGHDGHDGGGLAVVLSSAFFVPRKKVLADAAIS
jgi:hypothetical protein